MSVARAVRAAVGVAVLIILVVVVNGWWGDYRSGGSGSVGGGETTQTAEPPASEEPEAPADPGTDEPESAQPTVVVLIEGLNFRREPSREGELIRGLSRGTRLTLLETDGGWHHVRDNAGVEGYVSASEQYTEVQP